MRAKEGVGGRFKSGLAGCMRLASIVLAMALFLSNHAVASSFVDPLNLSAAAVADLESKPLRDISKAGARLVAVGESGLIILSDDHGVTWRQAKVPVSIDINSVHFSDEKRGWAVGHGAAVLHTQDGGETWVKQLDGHELKSIMTDYYSSGKTGLSKERAEVYLNAILDMTLPGPGQFFMGVWFDGAGLMGYAVGPFGLFMASEDGGQTWKPWNTAIENDDLLHLTAIREVGGRLLISGERGHVWIKAPERDFFVAHHTGYEGTLFGVTGNPGLFVAYGLRGNVFRSTDAGGTWQSVENNFNTGVVAGTVLPNGHLVLVSQSAQVAISDQEGGSFIPLHIAHPSFFTGVVGISGTQIALVGLNGVTTQNTP